MRILSCCLALIAGCGSCSDSGGEAASSNAQRGPHPIAPGAEQPSATRAAPSATTAPETPQLPGQPAAAAAPAAVEGVEKEAAEPEVERKRDYSAELQTAVGAPIDCLNQRTGEDTPAELKVELEAHFIDTGAATRAYARSGTLDGEELACIRKRLEAVRLAPPIEDAPRAVRTTLTFKLRVPDPTPSDKTAQLPRGAEP